MAGSFGDFSDLEKRRVEALLHALGPFRDIRQNMPLQYIAAFLLVCLNEGESVAELAGKADLSQLVMSRVLLEIGNSKRYNGAGLGLVTYGANLPKNRTQPVVLSDKGRAVAREIASLIAAASGRRRALFPGAPRSVKDRRGNKQLRRRGTATISQPEQA